MSHSVEVKQLRPSAPTQVYLNVQTAPLFVGVWTNFMVCPCLMARNGNQVTFLQFSGRDSLDEWYLANKGLWEQILILEA
jgi:hypothetical protein